LSPFFRQRRSFVPGAHTQVTRQIFRRLVRGLLQMANMILWNFKIPPVPVRAAEGAGFASRKYLKICVAYLTSFATFPRS
jgi:hypothetical protein